ncbi:WD40/YVTN/BNR-like repeat-containing protein [Longispora albida]|uniref:WD40/YVTN/BNR-like repeat-containing protein n=1 Tax=Longispora albida TaxID=203523 RepID=UPI000380EDD1|nr:hypothetical protein [Longispora albida]
MTVLLAIGTGKGLFLAFSEDDRRSWEISGPHFPMTAVYSVMIDRRRGAPRLLAGVTSSHFGPSVMTSDDLGVSWEEPDAAPIAFPADTGTTLERVWQLAPGTEPNVVYAGTQPSALFRSADGGVTYELVRPLWDHPHRPQWGAGFGGQAIHTILPHPHDANSILVAMSTGGVYRTADGGESWEPGNKGIKAYFLPDPWPEFGQCVHKVSRHPSRPEQLFAQNHHGVYRSEDGGSSWESIAEGLPSDFGFAMVNHPHRPGVIYAYPLEADGKRWPPGYRCQVFRSEDAGATWQPLHEGLPSDDHYGTVLRDAMCCDDAPVAGVYFGTRNGEVYGSRDEGGHWQLIASHLPDVVCVRAAAW